MPDRLRSAVPAGTVEPRHFARVVGGAVLVSLYAVWMAADLVARWLLFPLVAVVTGYLLFERGTARDQAVFVGYAFAVMILVTPPVVFVPDVTGGFDRGLSSVLTAANVLLFALFAVVAGTVAYVTYRVDGGRGVVQRIRGGRTD